MASLVELLRKVVGDADDSPLVVAEPPTDAEPHVEIVDVMREIAALDRPRPFSTSTFSSGHVARLHVAIPFVLARPTVSRSTMSVRRRSPSGVGLPASTMSPRRFSAMNARMA